MGMAATHPDGTVDTPTFPVHVDDSGGEDNTHRPLQLLFGVRVHPRAMFK